MGFLVADAVSASGVPRVVLSPDAVVLELEWLAELVDALPTDTTIEMTGDGVQTQTVALSSADRADGLVRIRFGGLLRGQAATITAKTGSTSLPLAQDHVTSDLENDLVWLHALDELLPSPASAPASSPDAGAGGDDTSPTEGSS